MNNHSEFLRGDQPLSRFNECSLVPPATTHRTGFTMNDFNFPDGTSLPLNSDGLDYGALDWQLCVVIRISFEKHSCCLGQLQLSGHLGLFR